MSSSAITTPADVLQAALDYARRGWHVLPCDATSKQPLTTHGFYDASTDQEKIRAWWKQWPRAMIGVRTGPESGIWVLDVDVPDGHASLGLLESEHGELLPTLSALSPSGGRHFYFRWVDGVKNTAGKLV
jgi:putative DNA primase/helicase